MKLFTIQENDAGQRLDKFLKKAAPGLPPALLYRALRTKHIKRNKKRAQGSDHVQTGDVIECWLPDALFAPPQYRYDFLQAGKTLQVLYEDAHVLVLDKPAGLLSHPDEGEYIDTLLGRVQRYLYTSGAYDPARENAFAPALANRLDRNTQGIVIAAKTAAALRLLNQRQRELRKFYLCAVHGVPKAGEKLEDGWRLLRGWHTRAQQKGMVRISAKPQPDAKEALTKYRVLHTAGEYSLLEIELLTGRMHQIRAQFAALGHSLAGERKYAPAVQSKQDAARGILQQCLCAYRLIFDFSAPAGELEQLQSMAITGEYPAFIRELFPDFEQNNVFSQNF